MQLKEIVNEILQKKFHGKALAMAQALQIGEMDIRRMSGMDPGSRRNQEKIFQITLKLLPFCKELDINLQPDSARELLHESIVDIGEIVQAAHDRTRKKGPGAASAEVVAEASNDYKKRSDRDVKPRAHKRRAK
jgi:hypothetical protein